MAPTTYHVPLLRALWSTMALTTAFLHYAVRETAGQWTNVQCKAIFKWIDYDTPRITNIHYFIFGIKLPSFSYF